MNYSVNKICKGVYEVTLNDYRNTPIGTVEKFNGSWHSEVSILTIAITKTMKEGVKILVDNYNNTNPMGHKLG